MRFFRRARRHEPAEDVAANSGLRVSPQVKASIHPDGVLLIDLAKGTVFSANRAGALIWRAAEERWSADRLASKMSGEFDIPKETAQRDAAEFLDRLKTEGLLIADAN